MNEEWRTVSGFSDYAVSSAGRVRGPRGILKTYPARYLQVTIYAGGKRKLAHVHRLVCEAFHGPCPSENHHAAHGDGNAHNNAASNLRWAARTENEADKVAHGTALAGKPSHVSPERQARGEAHGRATMPWRTARGERSGRSKLTEAAVKAIRSDSRPRAVLASEHGVSVTMIGLIQTRKSWAHVA